MEDKPTKSTAGSSGTVKLKTTLSTSAQVAPKIVQASVPITTRDMVKKPEFLEKAIARTEIKKRDAKPAIEAALAEMADLLANGHELNLPPLGKFKLVKSKDVGDGAKVLTLRLRTMKDSAGQPKMDGVDPMPEDGE